MQNNFKIAISGAASVGKTTISQYIAKKFELPFIGELVDEKLQLFNVNSLKELSINEYINVQRNLFYEKYNFEKNNSLFVSDRSLADYFVFWLNRCNPYISGSETDNLFSILSEHIRTYDYIFLICFRKENFHEHPKRSSNIYSNFRFEWILRSLYKVLNRKIIEINELSVESKINNIHKHLIKQ